MGDMEQLGKQIMGLGLFVLLLGGLIWTLARLPSFRIGKLPGDIVIQRQTVTVYIPVVTCVLASLLLTAVFFVIRMFKR